MKWDSHVILLQTETIVCVVIQQPHFLWGKLTLENLNLILNQMCTVREMKDKGLHCAADCCFFFFSSPRGATPHLFTMPVRWATLMDCGQENVRAKSLEERRTGNMPTCSLTHDA